MATQRSEPNGGYCPQSKHSRVETRPPPERTVLPPLQSVQRSPVFAPVVGPPPVLVPEGLSEVYQMSGEPRTPAGKRKRGRPRKNESPASAPQANTNSANNLIHNRYVADGNPQFKSRLSENSRLSRSDIRLSREAEAERLNNHKSKAVPKRLKRQRDCDSDWDSDVEKFDCIDPRFVDDRRPKRPVIAEKPQPSGSGRQSNDNRCAKSMADNSSAAVKLPLCCTQITIAEDDEEETADNELAQPESSRVSPIVSSVEPPLPTQPSVGQRIPDWLFHTKPKKFPYFPQIDDELVYIPYANRLYNKAVRDLKLYNPYTIQQAKGSEPLYCKVKKVEFEKLLDVRFAKLTMAEIDPQTNQQIRLSFTVKYHDIDNVLDFLIVRKIYDKSIANNWKPGDYFRAVVEDQWWFGNIHKYNINDNNMTTQFQALDVLWANGSTELLSYWDLERVQGLIPKNKQEPVDVTDADRQRFYEPEPNEWPACGRAEDCQRIVDGLTEIMELNEYKELKKVFNEHNDEYMRLIAYPINLEIVRERTRNLFYRRQAAVKWDIKFLERNATFYYRKTNESQEIIRLALIVVAVCLRFIDETKVKEVQEIYNYIIKDTNLGRFKYYSCVRHYLNPKAHTENEDALFGQNCLNILLPSANNLVVNNTSRESEVPVIDVSDSDEESNDSETGQSNDRVQEMVEHMSPFVVPPTAPETPPPAPVSNKSLPTLSRINPSVKSIPKPTQSVPPLRVRDRAPETEMLTNQPPTATPTTNSCPANRFYCVFCRKFFSSRDEALKHYLEELSAKLHCGHCPANTHFQSWQEFHDHDERHIALIGNQLVSKDVYENRSEWALKMMSYMDGLYNQMAIPDQISPLFGDFCLLCRGLNRMTPDGDPFFNQIVFCNHRNQYELNRSMISQFVAHMREHMQYRPTYVCRMCVLMKQREDQTFSCETLDATASQHMTTEHQFPPDSVNQIDQIKPLFVSHRIEPLDDQMMDAKNLFIINAMPY